MGNTSQVNRIASMLFLWMLCASSLIAILKHHISNLFLAMIRSLKTKIYICQLVAQYLCCSRS